MDVESKRDASLLVEAWKNYDPDQADWDFEDGFIHPHLCGCTTTDPTRRVGVVGSERLFASLQRAFGDAAVLLPRVNGEPPYLGIAEATILNYSL